MCHYYSSFISGVCDLVHPSCDFFFIFILLVYKMAFSSQVLRINHGWSCCVRWMGKWFGKTLSIWQATIQWKSDLPKEMSSQIRSNSSRSAQSDRKSRSSGSPDWVSAGSHDNNKLDVLSWRSSEVTEITEVVRCFPSNSIDPTPVEVSWCSFEEWSSESLVSPGLTRFVDIVRRLSSGLGVLSALAEKYNRKRKLHACWQCIMDDPSCTYSWMKKPIVVR